LIVYEHLVDTNVDAVEYCFCWTTEKLLDAFQKYGHGQVFGLDSIWKWTKHRLPFWALSIEIRGYGGIIVAIIGASQGTTNLLTPALRAFLQKANTTADVMPVCMIDHDPAECKALVELSVRRRGLFVLTKTDQSNFVSLSY